MGKFRTENSNKWLENPCHHKIECNKIIAESVLKTPCHCNARAMVKTHHRVKWYGFDTLNIPNCHFSAFDFEQKICQHFQMAKNQCDYCVDACFKIQLF